MNKIKFFLGSACLVLAIGAVAATKLNTKVLPEYYLSTAGQCVEITVASGCITGSPTCTKDFSATELSRPVYSGRINATTCRNRLQQN